MLVLPLLALLVTWRVVQDRRGSLSTTPRKVDRLLPDKSLVSGPCRVLQVLSGDRFEIEQQIASAESPAGSERLQETLTLLGVSAATSPPWQAAALEFSRDFLSGGEMRLDLDRRRIDRQGRFIGYVYVGDRLLNAELVRAGLAQVRTYPGDNMTMERQLYRAQDAAKLAQRGIWSEPKNP